MMLRKVLKRCMAGSSMLLVGIFVFLFLFALHTPGAYAASKATSSFVRVVHASPDVGTADVFVDGKKLLSNFEFATITGYVEIPPGPHKVLVGLIGKGPEAAVISQTIDVEPGVVYTVAALGTQAEGLRLKIFYDNNQVVTGKAKFRLYNLSPGVEVKDVAASDSSLLNEVSYPENSDYLALDAKSYSFNVAIDKQQKSIPVNVDLKQNTVTSVFAVGLFNGSPRLQFVSSQVDGVPGMPGTGSDPRPLAAQQTNNLSWLLASLAITIGLAATLVARYMVHSNKSKRV